ncbi:MAG: hypothetical protein ABIJ40_10205 [Bacteroidota bacterium]
MEKTLADYEKQVYELFDPLNTTNSLFKIAEQWYEESNRFERVVSDAKSDHKCAGCDTIIYYQSYCDNCRRLWES